MMARIKGKARCLHMVVAPVVRSDGTERSGASIDIISGRFSSRETALPSCVGVWVALGDSEQGDITN